MNAPASSWIFLALALLGLLMTFTSLAKATRLGWGNMLWFLSGWLTSELALFHILLSGRGCGRLLGVERRTWVLSGSSRARGHGRVVGRLARDAMALEADRADSRTGARLRARCQLP